MKAPAAFDFDGDYGEIYDDIARTVIPGYEAVFQCTLGLFRQRLAPGARVLVVGCGTGMEVACFAPAEPGWRITAVDPSRAMVDATAAVAEELGARDRVSVVCGLVGDLDESDFDAATVINVMHFLEDDGSKAGLLADVARRVRPGGLVALFDLHGDPGSDTFRLVRAAWTEYMGLRGLTGSARDRFEARLEEGLVYVSEARILDLCAEAGLRLVCPYFRGLLYGGWLLERTG